MTLESVNDLVGYPERWPLPLFEGTVMEIKPVSFDGGFSGLLMVKRVAPNLQTGLTGRRDLAPDLGGPSGATTSEVLAAYNACPFHLPKRAVEEVTVRDRWPFRLGGQLGFDGFACEPLRDGTQHLGALIICKDFNG
jgi:hypothetical protein